MNHKDDGGDANDDDEDYKNESMERKLIGLFNVWQSISFQFQSFFFVIQSSLCYIINDIFLQVNMRQR